MQGMWRQETQDRSPTESTGVLPPREAGTENKGKRTIRPRRSKKARYSRNKTGGRESTHGPEPRWPKKSRSWRGTGIGACTQRDKTEAQEKSNQMRGPDASHSRQPELIDAVPAVHLGIDPGHDEARENKEKRDCLMKGEVLHAARQAVKMTACMTNHYQQCGKKAHGCEGPEFAGWALAGWLRQNRSVARVDMGRKTGYDLRAQFVYPVWKRISSSCEVG